MRGVNYLMMAFIGLTTGLPGFALTWEKTSLDLILEAGSGDLVAEFPFKNESANTVTIRDLKSSCGCSTPTVKSRIILAGESGVISVAYAAEERAGLRSASLTVTTDEEGVSPATLLLKVDIRPALTFTPRLVHWTKANATTARIIKIKQLSRAPVRIVEIKPLGEALSAELKPVDDEGTWELTLAPTSPGRPSTTKVEIHVEVGGRKMTYTVFGVVR